MRPRRPVATRVKQHRTYTRAELAELLGVHENTLRHWRAEGLEPIDKRRPILFLGETVRAFLAARKARRRQPCPPGHLYCFRCRQPRAPALAMVDFTVSRPGTGNLHALCAACGTVMHRRARLADLTRILPGIAVQIRQAPSRLTEHPSPSLNCD